MNADEADDLEWKKPPDAGRTTMKLQQLSVFLENRPGQLLLPCQALAKAGINIITPSLADTQQFGILRLIVKEWEQAKGVLEKAGCVVNVAEVVPVKVPYRPGGLAGVLEKIEHAGVSVEYMYAIPATFGADGVIIFRFEQPDAAIKALKAGGVQIADSAEVWEVLGKPKQEASRR
jgi:hypothetical protein